MSQSLPTIGQLALRSEYGGANVATGGTPIADSQYNQAVYSPAAAFNGAQSGDSCWASGFSTSFANLGLGPWTSYPGPSNPTSGSSTFLGGGEALPWLGYDFGAGNKQAIVEIAITCQNTYAGRAPCVFQWQYSDNGLLWTTQRAVALDPAVPYVDGAPKVVDVDTPSLAAVNNTVRSTVALVKPTKYLPNMAELQFDPHTPVGKVQFSGFGPPAELSLSGIIVGLMATGTGEQTGISLPQTGQGGFGFGAFKIAGETTVLGQPMPRRVRLYHQRSGKLMREKYTYVDGVFEFDYIEQGPWMIIGLDDTGVQEGVIYTNVMAVPM